jgi:hypothetical protein
MSSGAAAVVRGWRIRFGAEHHGKDMAHRIAFLALAFAVGCAAAANTPGPASEGNDASAGDGSGGASGTTAGSGGASGTTAGSGGETAGSGGETAGSGGTAASAGSAGATAGSGGASGTTAGSAGATAGSGGTATSAGSGGTGGTTAGSGGALDASEEPGADASTDASGPDSPDATKDAAGPPNPDSGPPPSWMGPVNFTFDDIDAGASGWYSLLGPPLTALTLNTDQGYPTPPSLQFTIPFDALAQTTGASVGFGVSRDAGARDFTNKKALHAWVKLGAGSALGDIVLFLQTQGPAGPFAWNGVGADCSILRDGAWHELVFKLPNDIRPSNDVSVINQIGVQISSGLSDEAGVPEVVVIYVDNVWLE